jgi:hypothetical protein
MPTTASACSLVLLNRLESVDELDLRGKGRQLRPFLCSHPPSPCCWWGVSWACSRAEVAAARFDDRPAYTAAVLATEHPRRRSGSSSRPVPTLRRVVLGRVSSVGAVGIALVWLCRTRLSEPLRRRTWRIVSVGVKPLHAVHSGHVGDYATWLTVGPDGPSAESGR